MNSMTLGFYRESDSLGLDTPINVNVDRHLEIAGGEVVRVTPFIFNFFYPASVQDLIDVHNKRGSYGERRDGSLLTHEEFFDLMSRADEIELSSIGPSPVVESNPVQLAGLESYNKYLSGGHKVWYRIANSVELKKFQLPIEDKIRLGLLGPSYVYDISSN